VWRHLAPVEHITDARLIDSANKGDAAYSGYSRNCIRKLQQEIRESLHEIEFWLGGCAFDLVVRSSIGIFYSFLALW
jgi:hypothetical protein